MKILNILFDKIFCPKCGTAIPNGQTQCINPLCPTNRPMVENKKKL